MELLEVCPQRQQACGSWLDRGSLGIAGPKQAYGWQGGGCEMGLGRFGNNVYFKVRMATADDAFLPFVATSTANDIHHRASFPHLLGASRLRLLLLIASQFIF
jgi:hypothetical protein